jgi:tetratricopeptide (TPR) repeat protein
MFVRFGPVARALGLTVFSAATLAGQAAKECLVREDRPNQVGKARVAVELASQATDPAGATRQLVAAVRGLTDNADKMENQPGRNFVLGKALVLWSLQPGVQLVTRRGALGYTANPDQMIDLGAAIDSSFRVVEASNPECIPETAKWRGQKAWQTLASAAFDRLNADELDSALVLGRRVLQMNPYAPYGHLVIANVMQKKDSLAQAVKYFQEAYTVAVRDSIFADAANQSLLFLGNAIVEKMEVLDSAAKTPAGEQARKTYLDQARTAFRQIAADPKAGTFGRHARTGLCRIAIASGDTSSLRQDYKSELAEPSKYVYDDLMGAGVCFAQAKMFPEAVKLFEAGYEKNPYHRDVLTNLSAMYLDANDHQKSLEYAHRLMAVEPNNPESHQLLMFSYGGIARRLREDRIKRSAPAASAAGAGKTKTKGAAATKAAPAAPAGPRLTPAQVDSLFKLEKAYTDSVVAANEASQNLAYRLQISNFVVNEDKVTIAGNLRNQGSESKPVTVHFEFLDATGKVISSKDISLTPPAGSNARFNETVTPAKGVTAYRYSPIK